MSDENVVSEIRRALVAELRNTIPPGIDPMRGLSFDRAAERAYEIARSHLAPVRETGDQD